MTKVHFVYPHGPRTSCPDAIGREVGRRLRERYQVVHYDWDDTTRIVPTDADILLGHPHPALGTVFRRSARVSGWRKVIVLSPFSPGDISQPAFLDPLLVRHVDQYLAITGNYWWDYAAQSPFAHWLPKAVHVDLAVDRTDFPVLKYRFAPPGARRFVYIGHSYWYKNPEYLAAIASAAAELEINQIGGGDPIPGLRNLGYLDFNHAEDRAVVAQHDFLLTVGSADANPATVLESMAWGLIPICTPQSGYVGYEGIVNVPLNRTSEAVSILRRLQELPAEELERLQRVNWRLLDSHFNWDRCSAQVVDAIEAPAAASVERSAAHALRLRWAALTSPFSPLRPGNLRITARALSSH
jgi:glycosyltransferase involved in cell wall biosynthesis